MEKNINKIKGGYLITNPATSKSYYVQDLDKQQNSQLFVKGLNIIWGMTGKLGDFLRSLCLEMETDTISKETVGTQKYCNFIALVCDIALHDNVELRIWQVYHEDFNQYVANLIWNYYLDEDYKEFKTTGKCKFNQFKNN